MLGGGLGSGGLFGQTPGGGLGGVLGGGGIGGGGLGAGTSSSAGGLFGAKTGGGLFGNAGGNVLGTGGGGIFGQNPTSQATGGGLFGQGGTGGGILGGQTGGGLFQTPAGTLGARTGGGFGGTGLFGQTPALGTSVGATATGGGLFNQTTPQQGTSISGGLGGGVGGIFGSAGGGLGGLGGTGLGLAGATSGTTVKFEPVKGSDTVIKSGLTQNVNTLLQCITAMKHYEDKSSEELRMEDYAAGRKGPPAGLGTLGGGGLFGRPAQQQTGLGGGLFGAGKPVGGGLGGTGGGGLFNQQTSQTALGGAAGGGGLFGGQSKASGGGLFPGTSTSLGGGLGGGGGGLFGGQAQTGGGLFGAGNTGGGLFGQSNTAAARNQLGGGLFNKPTGLGTGGLGTGGLGGTTGLGLGGGLQTSTAGLGGGLGLGFLNNQPKPGGLGTGLGLQTGVGLGGTGFDNTGLGLGVQNRPMLATGGLGGGLGLGGGVGLGLGTGTGTGLGGLVGGQLGLSLNQNQAQSQLQALTAQQQEIQLKQQLEILAASPFGDSPLFRSAISDAAKQKQTSTASMPVVSKPSTKVTPHYKLSIRPAAKIHTMSQSSSSPSRLRGRTRLFQGLDDSGSTRGGGVGIPKETFVPRKSIKTLIITPKPTPPPLPDSTSPPHTDLLHPDVPPLGHAHSPPPQSSLPSTTPPAFSVAKTASKDESVDSPQLRLGTNHIEKPVPVRPTVSPSHPRDNSPRETTPTSEQATPPRPTSTTDSARSPSLTTTPTSGLMRQPLRSRDITSENALLGVVLRRSDYYTTPPLSELETRVVGGRCEVENFTVGREGFGQVVFLGLTDITGLNLDNLVSIGHKEVSVYPDDAHKPPVGQGLNKPARVTLEQSWPVCKTTHQPIRDQERLERMNYEEKLRRSTAKIGGKFIEYHHETGACVFEVEHFSKYKLQTDDDSEEEGAEEGEQGREGGNSKRPKVAADKSQPTTMQTRQTTSQTGQATFETGRSLLLDEDEAMSDDDMFKDAEEGVVPMEPHPPAPPPSHSMTTAMGLSTHRIQVMKASFFGDKERVGQRQPSRAPVTGRNTGRLLGPHLSDSYSGMEQRHGRVQFRDTPSPIPHLPTSDSTPSLPSHYLRKHATPVPTPSQSLLEFAGDSSSLGQPPSLLTPANLSALSLRSSRVRVGYWPRLHAPPPPSASQLHLQQSSVLMARTDLNTLVPLSQSMVRGRSRLVADAGLFMGRSFRVGWGPNWTLSHSGDAIHSGSGMRPENSYTTLHVNIEKVFPTPFMINAPPQKISPFFEPFLAAQLEHSEVESSSPIPRFHPREGTGLLCAFDSLSRHLPASRDGDTLAQRQMQLLWSLAMALWAELQGAEDNAALSDQTSYQYCLARRRAVSNWLMQAAAPDVEGEVASAGDTDSEYLGALFSLVSGRQIAAACRLAHKYRDHKLALLLSQLACGNVNSRQLAYEQMTMWRRMGTQRYISRPRLRLYALLAGLMVWEGEEGEGEVNVCCGLDWKRVFGLHLWYCRSPTDRVTEPVAQFTKGFQDDARYTLPPIPSYMEMAGLAPPTSGSYDNLTLDSCFHILRLYCARDHSLERTLNPPASTPFHLDYRISWHLWSILHSLHYTHLHSVTLSLLHQSFSAELEAVGLWHWAVFVLLHSPHSGVRERAVRGVLGRWCSGDEEMTEEEDFVVQRLKIPEQWVYSAKAGRAHYDGNYRQQVLHLLRAHQWNDAHSVIIDHLAANDIISGDTSSLHNMLETLSDPSCSADITNWDNTGSGYFDFLQISSRLQTMAQESEEVGSYELEELLAGLTRLAHRVRHLPARNPREILCQAEIAKRTAAYTKIVCDLKRNLISDDGVMMEPHPSREISHTLLPLPLPSDATLCEFRQLIRPHMTELAI